jgi:AraC-like DNA-binding protein
LLSDTSLPVSVVAARSGFRNVANVNRQFKTLKGFTPSQYRAQFPAGAWQRENAPELTERPRSLERKPLREPNEPFNEVSAS